MRESRALGLVWVRHIAVSWLFLGGSSLPAGAAEWVRAQPEGGEIKCVLPHPTIPDRVYVLLDTGVFRSDDGGQHWTETAPELTAVAAQLNGLAIHPENPGMFFAFGSAMVFRSVDGGLTWTELATDLPASFYVTQMIFVPGDRHGVLALLSNEGVYRSVDGGKKWENVTPRRPFWYNSYYLASDFTVPGHVYACNHLGFFESLDGGVSWRRLGDWPSADPIVADSRVRGRLYAVLNDRVSVSTDSGRTWTDIWGSTRRVIDIALDSRQTPAVLYARSRGSEAWRVERISRLPVDQKGWEHIFEYREPDGSGISELETSPSAGGLLFICPGTDGIYTSRDSGGTIRPSNSGLRGLQIRSITASPIESEVLLAGALDGRIFKSVDGGATWTHLGATGDYCEVTDLDIDPNDKNVVFALACYIWKSVDGGRTFTKAQAGIDPDYDYAVEIAAVPTQPGTLYASVNWCCGKRGSEIDPASTGTEGFTGLFKTTDAGGHWKIVSEDMYFAWDIRVDPESPDVAYVTNDDGLWRSTDGGSTFEIISPPHRSGLAFAIDPVTPRTLYFSVDFRERGLLISLNGGKTWRSFAGGLGAREARELLVDPNDHGVIYAGTDNGVYRRRVGAGPWSALGEPRFGSVDSLAVVGTESPSLMALTSNGGVFRWSE